ncbi:MAG: Gfo/Idh/MocA family oxidoreductase [Pedobacter sp.]|uniref:Gfo/Idh/MocA family protein n=1 Tax=Pedobacter sp. TaxID=1411316 RepID=UPI002809C7E0|nr:Gfo/Idh/MocA family oxidoreductase [Pedobacter sp.]MDQ8004338.1 Gfo/Idh/MocA family oxidoreductase [Pedobacter sp.]
MASTIKFAILGCGHIGKRHAELVLMHPEAELVAVIDPADEQKLQVSIFSVPHFKNLDDFLAADLAVDVVNICTPNGLHASQAITCLNHGINVVIEKPIALNIDDANAISVAASESGKYVFPVVQNRYSSTVKWLKDIADKGALGKIYMVQLNCFWNRDDQYYKSSGWRGTLALDGGPLFTQFSHFVDVLLWIFGDITNIKGKFANFNHEQSTEFEDSGVVTFDLKDGAVGSINYSTSAFESNFESSITVLAEKGTVKIGGQYMNCLEYCQIKGTEQPIIEASDAFNDYGSYKGSASNHQQVIENVIETLKNSSQPDVSLEEAIKVVVMISNTYDNRNVEEILLEKLD